eukprot:XP_001699041.1 predicted protein [Chlamydomonas reinhardtii]
MEHGLAEARSKVEAAHKTFVATKSLVQLTVNKCKKALTETQDEVDGLLLAIVQQCTPGPEDFKGPFPVGAVAEARLIRGMVGTGLRLDPGWAFASGSGASKLHKAKCGNFSGGCNWYRYYSVTGRGRTGVTLCGHKCCASAFKAEEVYLCAREAEAKAAAAEANANLLSLVEDMAAAGLAMKEEVEQAHERADVAGEVGAGVEVALSVEEAKNEFLGNILTNVLEALDKKEAEAAVEVEEARVRTQAAEQQARAAAREARSFLKEFVVGQPPADPNPLYLGPLSFGPTADLTLRNMVGTGQRLRPGWAFVNKSDGTKLHKAKCGNNEECSWYHYDSLAGRNSIKAERCKRECCKNAFAAEEEMWRVAG